MNGENSKERSMVFTDKELHDASIIAHIEKFGELSQEEIKEIIRWAFAKL